MKLTRSLDGTNSEAAIRSAFRSNSGFSSVGRAAVPTKSLSTLRSPFTTCASSCANTNQKLSIRSYRSDMAITGERSSNQIAAPSIRLDLRCSTNQQYDQILQSIRSRTTAEVLMQTDRVGAKSPQDQPDKEADKGLWWDYLRHAGPDCLVRISLPRRPMGCSGRESLNER